MQNEPNSPEKKTVSLKLPRVNVNRQVHAAEDVDGGNPFIHTTRSVNSIQVGLESARNDASNFTTPATTFRENLYAGEDTDTKGFLPPITSPVHKKSKR